MEKSLNHSYETDSQIKKIVTSKLFWIIFCGFFFGYPLWKSINRELPPPLPAIYQLPTYKLTNQFGKPFGTEELKGKIYIASFFFTSCPTVCPKLMDEKKKIQHRVRGLGTKVALVTYTVDPETDTPDVLNKRAEKLQANPHIWNFLTGTEQELEAVIVGGFKTAMGNKEEFGEASLYDIAHSQKFVLVDAKGQVRGFYSSDTDGINKMMIDLGLLANRELSNS